jgi:hypothetical protein
VIDQRLNVGLNDRVDSTIAKLRKDVGVEMVLIGGSRVVTLCWVRSHPLSTQLFHRYASTSWIEHYSAKPINLDRRGIGVCLLLTRKRACRHTTTDPGSDVVTVTDVRQPPPVGGGRLTSLVCVAEGLGDATITISPADSIDDLCHN